MESNPFLNSISASKLSYISPDQTGYYSKEELSTEANKIIISFSRQSQANIISKFIIIYYSTKYSSIQKISNMCFKLYHSLNSLRQTHLEALIFWNFINDIYSHELLLFYMKLRIVIIKTIYGENMPFIKPLHNVGIKPELLANILIQVFGPSGTNRYDISLYITSLVKDILNISSNQNSTKVNAIDLLNFCILQYKKYKIKNSNEMPSENLNSNVFKSLNLKTTFEMEELDNSQIKRNNIAKKFNKIKRENQTLRPYLLNSMKSSRDNALNKSLKSNKSDSKYENLISKTKSYIEELEEAKQLIKSNIDDQSLSSNLKEKELNLIKNQLEEEQKAKKQLEEKYHEMIKKNQLLQEHNHRLAEFIREIASMFNLSIDLSQLEESKSSENDRYVDNDSMKNDKKERKNSDINNKISDSKYLSQNFDRQTKNETKNSKMAGSVSEMLNFAGKRGAELKTFKNKQKFKEIMISDKDLTKEINKDENFLNKLEDPPPLPYRDVEEEKLSEIS